MQLGASALILALIVGGALGIIAALNQNKLGDYAVIALATAGSTIPTFVIAPVIQLVFGLTWMLLPIGGWGDGALRQQDRPDADAGAAADRHRRAADARLDDRSRCASTISAPRARSACPTGRWWSAMRCAARFCRSSPIAGPAAAALLTGSVIVETIFAIPGVGRYFVDAALNRDYTLVMGTVVVIALFTIVFNLIVDLLYAVVDPQGAL